MFGPSLRSNGTTMPSADFCNLIPSPLSDGSSKAKLQISPGNALSPSRLCPPHLRTSFPYRYRTLKIFALSSSLHASYAISVRRTSALPAASFRFHLAMDALADQLTIPPVGFVGDFHSLVRTPCRAHKEKGCTAGSSTPFVVRPKNEAWLELETQPKLNLQGCAYGVIGD
jgi:hypothetical protein